MTAATTEQKKAKIPFWVKLGYGGFEWAYGLIWPVFYVFFMKFATDVVGLRPILAGVIMMFSGLGDAISDPFTGILCDKLDTRWGRRRPILLVVAVPYALATWLLFTDPGWGETATVVYFSVVVIVFYTLIDLIWTPGLALGAEMTLDYDERTSLAGYRTAWDFAGSVVSGFTCLLVVEFFSNLLGSERAGWSAMAALFGIVAILPVLLTWRTTRGYERYRSEKPKLSLGEIWQAIVGNKAFFSVIGIHAFAGVSFNCVGAALMYYSMDYLGYDEGRSSLLLGVITLMQLAWIPALSWLGRKLGKRRAMIYIYVVTAVVFAAFWFVRPMEGREMGVILALVSLVACVCPALFSIGGAMVADTVEVDEFKTGQRREGIYFSTASFVQKAAVALALLGSGILLEETGYVAEAAEQNASVIAAIKALVSWAPAVLIAISAVFAFLNPMTKEKHAVLLQAIEAKKIGEEYDIEPIKNLVA